MSSAQPNAQKATALHRFAVFTAGATVVLLAAGALVTSNDAGLAVPDWPLSYGTWMPPMVGNILYEHGHRMIATFVGLLTIILAVWILLREPRRWVRGLGLAALGTVVLQGILGGVTVLFLLPPAVSIAHATLAQVFFCLAVSLAVFTGPGWRSPTEQRMDSGRPSLFDLTAATTLLVFLQLILGAAYRHSLVDITPHLVGAIAVAFFIVRTARRVQQQHNDLPALQRPARVLLGLLWLQLALGGGAYLSRLATADAPQPALYMVALTVAHVVVGALVLATSLALALHAHRLLARAEKAPSVLAAGEEVSA
ncbi:MAG: COX15/CtaA family protein [Candidatus Acidiferrales bacterium]